jgi:hypothetical protein
MRNREEVVLDIAKVIDPDAHWGKMSSDLQVMDMRKALQSRAIAKAECVINKVSMWSHLL